MTNTAPTATISGNPTSDSGVAFILNLSSSDPGNDNISAWHINWGDGTLQDIFGGTLTSAAHSYATPGGTRTITASVTDEDGTFSVTGTAHILTVNNSAPSVPGVAQINIQPPLNVSSGTSGSVESHRAETTAEADSVATVGTTSGVTLTVTPANGSGVFVDSGFLLPGSDGRLTGRTVAIVPADENGDDLGLTGFEQAFASEKSSRLFVSMFGGSGSDSDNFGITGPRRATTTFMSQQSLDSLLDTNGDELFRSFQSRREAMYRQIAVETTRQVDSFEENLTHNVRLDSRLAGSVGVVTTGFSVGYLLWAVRGGMLLSGLLAQIPAWTMLDPLLVIDGDSKDEDKESLQTIMERQQAKLNEKHTEIEHPVSRNGSPSPESRS